MDDLVLNLFMLERDFSDMFIINSFVCFYVHDLFFFYMQHFLDLGVSWYYFLDLISTISFRFRGCGIDRNNFQESGNEEKSGREFGFGTHPRPFPIWREQKKRTQKLPREKYRKNSSRKNKGEKGKGASEKENLRHGHR